MFVTHQGIQTLSAHQLANLLLAGPDLPVFHQSPIVPDYVECVVGVGTIGSIVVIEDGEESVDLLEETRDVD